MRINGYACRIPVICPAIGDFDNSGDYSSNDIDLLAAAIAESDDRFDLTGDGVADMDDHAMLVQLIGVSYGDANFDGVYNSTDLIVIFQANEYEDGISRNSTWAEGDWNGDQDFNSGDLVTAFSLGLYIAG